MTSTIQVCQFADSPTAPHASNNNTVWCSLCPVLPLYFWTLIWLSGCQCHRVSSVLYGTLPHSSVELAWSTHPYTLLLHSTDCPVSAHVPCNLETSRSLQTARWPCSLQTARPSFQWTTCTCVLWRDNFKENRENCHDFIVLYCVRNWEGISVVENLVRHNNHSFRANKLVIVSPNYKQENE